MTTTSHSERILRHNARFIPGGLSSLNRQATPTIAFARAQGAKLWDVDGKEYIDYHAGFAPYLLGHNDPDVNQAVLSALENQLSNYGSGPTELEGELAELFLECVPTADLVQFFNTGSEATAQSIRVARAATGRSHVLLVQGSYNGHHNAVAANLMTSRADLGAKRRIGKEYPLVTITAGIPPEERGLMHAVEFNDLDAVEAVARRHELACMITEPVLQNVGVVKPQAGYLEGLRSLADKYGFVLIFDEVKTGFRAHLGGYQAFANVTPDLSTFGKALANGMPLAALAGKRDYMQLATADEPRRRVLVAGTYNAHPLPVAAAIACLNVLRDPRVHAYERLERLADKLARGQQTAFARHGISATISRVASAHCVYFMESPPSCWWDILECHDFAFDTAYRRALIERGVYHFPVPVKQGSISLAHTEADIEATLERTNEALEHLTQHAASR
ncbi:MAG: aspartate aminotransferase family protein [Pirellulales bacterium]